MVHYLILKWVIILVLLFHEVTCKSFQRDVNDSPATGSNQLPYFRPDLSNHSENEDGYFSDGKDYVISSLNGNENNVNHSDEIHSRENLLIDVNQENFTLHIDDASKSFDRNWNLTLKNFYATYPVDQWKAYGFFDESYLEKINPHWLRFEPASTVSHLILACLYVILMVVGCFGNLLVVFMFLRCRSLRTPANYLIANLAVSDFGMLLKTPIFIINSIFEGPVLGMIGCQIYGFVGGLTGITSIMTLATIAVDRYCVIVHPLNPYKKTTRSKAILMIAGVWIYSGFFSSIPIIALNGYVSEGYLTSCSFDYLLNDTKSKIFIFIIFLAAWFVPLSCIIFSYLAIFRVVAQAERMEIFTGENARESCKSRRLKEKMRKDVKIAILSTTIVLMWILAWTPYAIVALLGVFGQKQLITPFVSSLPALFCKISSCINPFVYSISHPKFQKELKIKYDSIICCRKVNTLRTCSVRSVSFGASISDNNTMFISKKIDDHDHLNKDGCFHVAIHSEFKPSASNGIQIQIHTSDCHETSIGCEGNRETNMDLKSNAGEFKDSLRQIRRTHSESDVSFHEKMSSVCNRNLNKLHSKFNSLTLSY